MLLSVTPPFLNPLLSVAATGLAIWFINLSVENFAGFKFSVTFAAMRYSYFLSFLVYVLSNTALVLMSSLVVCYYAPASAGSGIPEIKGYLNGIDMPGEDLDQVGEHLFDSADGGVYYKRANNGCSAGIYSLVERRARIR
jgi:hypothetical protein